MEPDVRVCQDQLPQTAQNVTTAPSKDTICHVRFDLFIQALKHKYMPPIDSSNVRRKKTSNTPIDVLAPGSRPPVADARSHFAQKNMTPNHNNAAGILIPIDNLPVEYLFAELFMVMEVLSSNARDKGRRYDVPLDPDVLTCLSKNIPDTASLCRSTSDRKCLREIS